MKKSLMGVLVFTALVSCSKTSQVQDMGSGATLSGLITVAPALQAQLKASDTLFIIARKDVGPPLAVKKIANPSFPLAYVLTGDDAMFPGTPFQGEIRVSARIDRDGFAGPAQPGDLEGSASKNPARVGDWDVDIQIDKPL